MLKIPFQLILWLVTVVFFAGVAFATWSERSYVDTKIDTMKESMTQIKIDQAKILEKLSNMDTKNK